MDNGQKWRVDVDGSEQKWTLDSGAKTHAFHMLPARADTCCCKAYLFALAAQIHAQMLVTPSSYRTALKTHQ